MQQAAEYLKPTSTIDCDTESIKEKAEILTEGEAEVVDKAKRLFYFVRDEIDYTFVPIDLLQQYRASKTLERGKGFCVEKAALLAALARAVGIPARLHFADIRNHLANDTVIKVMGTNLFSYHGYSELYVEGKWVKATPAFDLKMCQQNRIVPVDFDGKNDAIFHSHNLDGQLHIEYVQDHGYREDVPVDEILASWAQLYRLEANLRRNDFTEVEKAQEKAPRA